MKIWFNFSICIKHFAKRKIKCIKFGEMNTAICGIKREASKKINQYNDYHSSRGTCARRTRC